MTGLKTEQISSIGYPSPEPVYRTQEKYDKYDVDIDPTDGSVWSIQRRPTPLRRNTRRQHNYWFIGDIHSNIESYLDTLNRIRKEDPDAITIQVGDIDIGSVTLPELNERDFFIQGNHDDIHKCVEHPSFLGKYGYKHGVFYLGGASTPGMGYKEEELSPKELNEAIELYEKTMPEIVVTHDCPTSVRESMFYKKDEHSRTNQALEEMFAIHNPLVWAFGHYHSGMKEHIDGTDFICLAPLYANQLKLTWTVGFAAKAKELEPVQMTAKKAIGRWFQNLNPLGK